VTEAALVANNAVNEMLAISSRSRVAPVFSAFVAPVERLTDAQFSASIAFVHRIAPWARRRRAAAHARASNPLRRFVRLGAR